MAQEFGGNPASLHWKQINTDTLRVIFPEGLDQKAKRIASIVQFLQKNKTGALGNEFRKINIVLQNETLMSNGYVSLAPFRSEFYLNPPQNPFSLGAVSWADNLAVHEYRHVQQYSNFNKGLSGFATFLLGEQGQALANAIAIPDWFFEGDAVFNETALTQQGRGTLPLFFSGYKSLFNNQYNYRYAKLRNGSLRNYVPDHYALGYLLVAYGRKKYGNDIWANITNDAARFKPLLYPFQGALQKHTGTSYRQFVNDALQFYRLQWKNNPADTPEWVTAVEKNNVVNYLYPYPAADGSVIVLKTSRRDVPSFYQVHKDHTETKIAVKDISATDYFSCNNGKIVYTAFEPDPRWGNRDFHAIRLVDINTGEERKIRTHTKYQSPDISHNGDKIAAVQITNDTAGLALLDAEKGELIQKITEPGSVFSCPKFSADDRRLYWVSRNQKGEMCIRTASLSNPTTETLLPYSNRIIGNLLVQGDTLLFATSFQGRDEIWAIIDGKETRGPFRLATYTTGLYQGWLQTDGSLLGSAFTADGYRLGSFQPKWERIALKNELEDLYLSDIFTQSGRNSLQTIATEPYPVSKYRKSFQLLNLHSFRPFYEQPEYSLTVYGQNILNTLRSEIAYTYNQNEGSHKLGYNAVYGGTYLQPVLGISQNWQRMGVLNKDTSLNWNELIAYAGLQLPLNLTSGKQYRSLTLSGTWNTEQVSWTGLAQKLLANRSFQYLNMRIAFSQQIQKSAQQIYPHSAQSLVVQYKNILNKYTAHQLLLSGSVYLPGFSTNHSLVFTAAYQARDTMQQYLFSNNFPFARGYQAVDFPRSWKIGVNYHFPIAFPDWGFGQMVYFLRIRSNLFFDYTQGKSLRTGLVYPFKTVGTELFFDTRWWNQQPVTFGIRYSRLLDNEFRGTTIPNVWELVLPVNLFN